jgi:nucleoside-diphosphate-sugar epimerase
MTLESVLVAGATGFIGSSLVAKLAQNGSRVTCLVRPGARADMLAAIASTELVPFAQLDMLRGRRFDVAFNLASYGVNQANRDPERMIDGNVTVLARVLTAAGNWSLRRFVHVGSCSEYAPISPPELLVEDHPLEPTYIYGAAKAAAHLYGTALARQLGIELVTLRPFGTYGPGEDEHRLIPYLLSRLRRGEQAQLSSGEQFRDLTYVDDVVEALITAGQTPHLPPYRAYNVCSGVPVRIREVAELVAKLLDQPLERLRLGSQPMRAGQTLWMVGNPARFRAATGWQPLIDLQHGVRLMLDARPDAST